MARGQLIERFAEDATAETKSTAKKKKKRKQTKQSNGNLVALIQNLTTLLGRRPTREDMILSYKVSMELPCLSNFSSKLETAVAYSENDDGAGAKDSIAKAMLAALDFEKLKEEKKLLNPQATEEQASSDKPEASKKKKEKKQAAEAPKAEPVPLDAEVGQSLEGTVKAILRGGLVLDVGKSQEPFLPVQEITASGVGFPPLPTLGSKVQTRVLKLDPFTVTMRSGDLARTVPEKVRVAPMDMSGVDHSIEIDADVVNYTFREAFVKVSNPSDAAKVTVALLPINDIPADVAAIIAIGTKLKVRLKIVAPTSAVVTMKDTPPTPPSSFQVGQTVSGAVERIRKDGNLKGSLIEIGSVKLAVLSWQEYADGWGNGAEELAIGRTIEARVLRVKDDTVFLTRRSGSLERPEVLKASFNDADKVKAFSSLSKETWLEGTITSLGRDGLGVKVQSPDGVIGSGLVVFNRITDDFKKIAGFGMSARVRLVTPKLEPNRFIQLSMKGLSEHAPADLPKKVESKKSEKKITAAVEETTSKPSEGLDQNQQSATTLEDPPQGGLNDPLLR